MIEIKAPNKRSYGSLSTVFLAGSIEMGSAIDWQSYIKEYPNGPEWSDCQNAIINAEFQLGLDALTMKQQEVAMKRFDSFLRDHPLDQRAPRILYLFGAAHEAAAHDAEDTKAPKATIDASYRKAI